MCESPVQSNITGEISFNFMLMSFYNILARAEPAAPRCFKSS